MAVLVDHDTRRNIGVLESYSLGPDKVLRGVARFDEEDPDALKVLRKIRKGQMRFTSVGYALREMEPVRRDKKEGDAYRAVKWTPYEVSFVSVPADPTVGAGREMGETTIPVVVRTAPEDATAPQGQENAMSDKDNAPPSGAPADVRVTRTEENTREKEIKEIIELAEQHGMRDRVSTWVNADTSLASVRKEIMGELKARLDRGPVIAPPVTLTEKEQKNYSLARAILAAAGDEVRGFEHEVSEQLAKRLPQGYRAQGTGFFFPTNIRAGLDSATSTKGTELKFDVPGSFIEQLRNRARVLQAGAQMLSGLSGPVTFPKQNGAGTASWVGENPGSDVSESNLLLTTVTLTAKTLQSTTSFSKQLLRQAVVDVENLVRSDIAAIHALAIDAAVISGTGSSNQPGPGLVSSTSVNSLALGTNGGAPDYEDMVDLEKLVEEDNADIGPMAYLTTPGIKAKLKKTQEFATTNGVAVWKGGQEGQVNGYRAFSSNQVPSNLTKGTSTTVCHAVIFGVWSQILLGEWGMAEILVDPYALKKQGMIEVTSFQMIDFALRHAQAFAVIKDATA